MSDPTVTLLPVDRAAQLIASYGFLLVHGERQGGPGGANLLVALRGTPTLQHFDPERVMYWVTAEGRGRHLEIDRGTEVPYETEFAWGALDVTDRLEVSNSFLTFGGHLAIQALDPATTLVSIGSPAPILRWTGHSQDVDPFSAEVAAFFARLRVPINFTTGAESWIGALSPMALYAAVIGYLRHRYSNAPALRDAHPEMDQLTSREGRWLQSAHQAEWSAGERFLAEIGFVPAEQG
jgi:hypothetical protein